MKKTKLIPFIVLLSVVLLACLGALGYFGIKSLRRSHLRTEAREAFAAEDWKAAEKLLNKYVGLDPDSEEDFVRLAQVYGHFGNSGEEMRCWHRASTLNPLKPEYWDNYIVCAMKARDFQHLYTTLSRKILFHENLAPKERMLYLISAVMTNRAKEAEKTYGVVLKANPEAFRLDDLARYAEFLVTIRKLSDGERSNLIEQGIRSDDPFVRLEFILFYLGDLVASGSDAASIDEQMEKMLKEAAELNRFAGTPYLANYYFSRLKFAPVIETAEPYLADIENYHMSILYAESCVYGAQPEKLKPFAEKIRTLGPRYKLLASYFDALYLFSQGSENNDELARLMQETGGTVHSELANLVELQIALNNDILEKICTTFETIMKNPPFYNVQERARVAVRYYLQSKIVEDPKLAVDPRMVKLAQLLSASGGKDPLLMRIILSDQHERNMLTEQIIQDDLKDFPYDPYLLQIAAEFELFNGHPERSLEYTERFNEIKDETTDSTAFDILQMLALELSGKIDEAAGKYAGLVDKADTDLGILARYFDFCVRHERREELSRMAERLSASTMPDLKALAPFFRAETLFLEEKPEEALSLLETAKTDQTDFMLYAADKFGASDRADQALSRYLALVGRHPDQRVILANIAEIQMTLGKKAEALSYAKRCWEMDQNDGIGQFVYARMLAADGRYQDAEKVLRIPNREVKLPDAVGKIWTDVMTHCVREDLEKGSFTRALDRAKHYLVLFPDDAVFQEFKARAEKELKRSQVLPKKDAETDTSEAAAS